MPSHRSAEKRVRVTAKRTAANKSRRSQIRSAIRVVEEALVRAHVDYLATPWSDCPTGFVMS